MPESRWIKLSISKNSRNDSYVASLRSDAKRNARELKLKPHSEDIPKMSEGLTGLLGEIVRRLVRELGMGSQVRVTAETQDVVRKEFQLLAARGYAALDDIFDPPDLRLLRELVGTASRVILDIDSDLFVFPWELLYDDYQYDRLEYSNFWGFKYIVYRNIPPRPGQDPPGSDVEFSSVSVGLLADQALPMVREEISFLKQLEMTQLIKLISPSQQLESTQRSFLLDTELRLFLSQAMDVVHFACHTRAPVPEAREPKEEYCLLISKDFPLWRSDFSTYKLWFTEYPLVILNACGTSPRQPLATRNMVRKFLEHGARGVITTECIVPDALAEAFTRHFYPRILSGQELGDALFETRKTLLQNPNNNPLGLLYALYAFPSTRFIRTD